MQTHYRFEKGKTPTDRSWLFLAASLAMILACLAAFILWPAWPPGHALAFSSGMIADEFDLAEEPEWGGLEGSSKTAERHMLRFGEALTYTIWLHNASWSAVDVKVNDPLPAELSFIDGSLTGGGAYDSATHTISWAGVSVQAKGFVPLSFAVTPRNPVEEAILITNTATIASAQATFERRAWIVQVPESGPRPMLAGSYKCASQRFLGPGEVLTYTIRLNNNGTTEALIDVSDPVPVELEYVADSVTGGGLYDPASRTLTWNRISVPPGDRVSLTFQATPAMTVEAPMVVTNTAFIQAGELVLERRTWIALLPESPVEDPIPPQVNRLVIGDGDVLYDPQVRLQISASDNLEVSWMYLREWELAASPRPHWRVARSSGWLPYQPEVEWTLGSSSGVHFIGVWVADAALNLSQIDHQALDFASLLLPGTTVPPGGLVPYLVYYPQGVEVKATLTPTQGNVDLYVWYPGNFLWPDQASVHPDTAAEEMVFTTSNDGTYLFLVHSTEASTYDFAIAPAGGPRHDEAPLEGATSDLALQSPRLPSSFVVEPLLSQAGLDPLGSEEAASPQGPYLTYVPVILR